MRLTLSVVLIALLAANLVPAQQPAADSAMKVQIAAIPSTSLVEVSTQGGDTLRGHIVNRTDSDFSLRLENGAGTQKIAYSQVLSVSQLKSGHSHRKAIIITVVVGAVAVAVVFGVLFALAASHI